jgi:Tfp pilus assembly protein FimT
LTVVELLTVLAIIGLLLLAVFPRAGMLVDSAAVRGARTVIANKFTSARNVARSSNKVVVLRLANNRMWIERNAMSGTSKDTVGGFVAMDSIFRVTVTGPDSIRIDPRGLITTNQTTSLVYVAVRAGRRDSVVINGYGRITR